MIGVIGGTGLGELFESDSHSVRFENFETPYGLPSAPLEVSTQNNRDICFLARHGKPHSIPPHRVNYRANIYALRELGVEEVIAVNAVGGIHEKMGPEGIAIPNQIIDYSYGREHTFYDGNTYEHFASSLEHIDFTHPYSSRVRDKLNASAKQADIAVLDGGVYAVTQGPRLESAAEILRLQRDGADMVGMTGMPEASLARELGLEYASLSLSVNWCAGLTDELITMEDIHKALEGGIHKVKKVIFSYLSL